MVLVWSSWYPASSQNWFAENNITFLLIPIIFGVCIWYNPFSKLSFTLIAIFVTLHLIGSHYNYGSVPFGNTLGDLLEKEGNIYDKFVHFSFGLLIFYPLREFFVRSPFATGLWLYLLPFIAIMGLSALYEIFEWVTVLQLPTDVAHMFIGGNDPFDTTKDMLMAGIGALISLFVIGVIEKIKGARNEYEATEDTPLLH